MTTLNILESCDSCIECATFVQYDNYLGICDNSSCDHYAHCLSHNHPACDAFRYENDILNKVLDNHQDV
jgi:hypothetical protein